MRTSRTTRRLRRRTRSARTAPCRRRRARIRAPRQRRGAAARPHQQERGISQVDEWLTPGRVAATPEALRLCAESLCKQAEVALEATCNTHAIARLLEQHVARVVMSN